MKKFEDNMDKNNKPVNKDKYHPPLTALIIISILVIVIQALGGYYIYKSINNWSDRSSFGDMFGAIGTLFSGLAFAGVIYTILLQREELKRTSKAQEQSEQSLAEQSKALMETARLNSLSFFPAINCKINLDAEGISFIIQNPSNVPAFDIDLWTIGVYSEEDIDIPTFIVNYLSGKRYRDYASSLNSTDEDIYGISDHMVYAIFPQKQQNKNRLDFPLNPDSIYAVIQFRDIKGTNYHQMYWFFPEKDKSPNAYRLGSLEPVVPTESDRMEFYKGDDLKVPIPTPKYLLEFIRIFNSSLSATFLRTSTLPMPEDRGKWDVI